MSKKEAKVINNLRNAVRQAEKCIAELQEQERRECHDMYNETPVRICIPHYMATNLREILENYRSHAMLCEFGFNRKRGEHDARLRHPYDRSYVNKILEQLPC